MSTNYVCRLNDKKVDMVYDYQGRRVEKLISNWTGVAWVPESTKRFVYDGWNVIEEQGVTSKYYVWGLDLSQSMQGAGGIGGLLTQVDVGAVKSYAYTYDGNGNVGQLLDNTDGSIDAHYEYDPYGNELVASGVAAAGNPYRFSTKYFVLEYGLYDYGKRFYDPSIGRWLNRDPIDEFGGLNLYGFIGNDAINAWDLLGERRSGSYNVRGTGHHTIPVELWEEFGFPDEAKKVFDDATYPVRTTTSTDGIVFKHDMTAHGPKTGYTAHVRDEITDIIDKKKIKGKTLKVDEYVDLAKDIVKNVENSTNPFIRGFLRNVGDPIKLRKWQSTIGSKLPKPKGLKVTKFNGIKKIKLPRVVRCRKVPIIKYAFLVGASYLWYVDYNNARADGLNTTLAGALATARAADPGIEMVVDFGYITGSFIGNMLPVPGSTQ